MKATTIDVHTHVISNTYLKALDKAGITSEKIGFPMQPWDLKARLAEMDEFGVQAQVLSVSSPGLRFWDGEEAAKLARALNEELAAIVREHPTRFGAYATVPLPDVPAALNEIAYCLDELKMDGVCLMTNYEGRYPGDPDFAPVMQELNRRKAVVFMHPTESVCIDQLNFGYPAPMIEYPFESTRMVVSLLDSDTITRCPDIKFIVSHGGGTLSITEPRIQELAPMKHRLNPEDSAALAAKLKQQIATLYFDMAIVCFPPSLAAIQLSHDSSKLMMGFDQPFIPAPAIGKSKKTLQEFRGFSDKDHETIDSGTAQKLFPELARRIKD